MALALSMPLFEGKELFVTATYAVALADTGTHRTALCTCYAAGMSTIDNHTATPEPTTGAEFSAREPDDAHRLGWIAENIAALYSSNRFVEQHGLPLAQYRRF